GILAVGAVKDEVQVREGEFVARKIMRVTLSADHRAVDGAVGAAFLQQLTGLLEDPLRIIAWPKRTRAPTATLPDLAVGAVPCVFVFPADPLLLPPRTTFVRSEPIWRGSPDLRISFIQGRFRKESNVIFLVVDRSARSVL